MSGPDLEVDPERLRRTASQLRSLAESFQSAKDSFEAEVTGFGQPWGGDDLGMIIGVAHDAIFQAAVECFTTNADELLTTADKLRTMADNHQEAEDTSKYYVNKISELL